MLNAQKVTIDMPPNKQDTQMLNDEFYYDKTNVESCKHATAQAKIKDHACCCFSGSSMNLNLPLGKYSNFEE